MSRMATNGETKGKRREVKCERTERRENERERKRDIHCLWISGVLPPGRITTTGLTAYERRLRRSCNGTATFT